MKRFNKILSYLLVVIVLLSTCLISQTDFSANAGSMRDVTAMQLLSEVKIGVNIGNSLDSVGSSETAWGNPKITRNLIRKYKELGFDTIRLPVTWRNHIDSNGYPEKSWLDRVQEVVDWILDEDLKCIINTHHEQNWLNTNSSGMTMRKTKFINLWTDVAKRFKNYDENLMFEAFNEILKKESDWSPADEIDYQNANELSQIFVDTVRATGGNNEKRILIINTYGAIREVYGFALPTDIVPYKLAVQFHAYDPQGFCFAGSKSTWSTSDGNIIDSYCRLFYESFVSKGVPVILGEFGAVDKSNEYDRAQYAKVVAQNCVKYGIKPVWWDDGGDFKLISRQNYNVLFPQIVSALIENSSLGILPSATTYTYTTKVPLTYTQPPSTTPKSTTTTTKPNIKVDKVTGVVLNEVLSSEIDIGWNPVNLSNHYNVYRSFNGGKFEFYKKTSSNSFYDTGLSKNNYYQYKITACRIYAGYTFESEFSDVVTYGKKTTPVVKIDGFKVKNASVNSVKINWKKVKNAAYYVVFRAKNKASFIKLKNVKDLVFTDKKLTRGATYSYYVVAYNSNNVVIGKSDKLNSTILAKTMGKVTCKTYKKSVDLKFKKVNGATGYEIKYSLDKKLKKAKVKNTKNLNIKIKNLKKGKKYYFSVRAYKIINNKKVYTNAKKISVKTKK